MAAVIQRVHHWFLELTGKAAGPADEWQVLVKKYTGLTLVIHMVLASIFFLPLGIRLLILSGVLPGATEAELESLQLVLEKDVSTWDLLIFGFLGTDSVVGWCLVGLSVALLIYNILRLLLTIRVAIMRRSPTHPSRASYHWMYRIHMPWMYFLLTLSLSYAALRIYDALNLRAILSAVE